VVSRWRAALRTGDRSQTYAHSGDRWDDGWNDSQSAAPASSRVPQRGTTSLSVLLQYHMRGIRGAEAIASAGHWCAREESNLYPIPNEAGSALPLSYERVTLPIPLRCTGSAPCCRRLFGATGIPLFGVCGNAQPFLLRDASVPERGSLDLSAAPNGAPKTGGEGRVACLPSLSPGGLLAPADRIPAVRSAEITPDG
jgi:hypothetical protein